MVSEYLSGSETLKGAVLIVDIRRDPDERDIRLAKDLVANGIPTLIIATKVDKLNQSRAAASQRKLEQEFSSLGVDQVMKFSSVTGIGKKQLWQRIDTKI